MLTQYFDWEKGGLSTELLDIQRNTTEATPVIADVHWTLKRVLTCYKLHSSF